VRWSERFYRRLLGLYPREFRDEYGDEMSKVFRDRVEHGRLRLWLQVLGDLLFHAPHEHWSIAKQDVRYALRSWRRTPVVPAVALSALTLGMGANIAIFSAVHAVLLRPLPVAHPEQLMVARETSVSRGIDASAVSMPNYRSWKEQARSIALAAFSGQTLTWTGTEYPERLEAFAATESFLSVIGASVPIGRWFTADESRLGKHRVAVLSHRLWQARFDADPGAVGRQLTLNGAPYTIIGVASARLSIPSEPDLWVPQVIEPSARRDNRYLSVVGRLRPAVTREQAQAEMATISAGLERAYPSSNKDYRISVTALSESLVSDEIRTALIVLFAAATLVLLIACGNVASVLLSKAVARQREMAIRAALGAGAARITRQLLTESALLSTSGAVLGLLVSAGLIAVARRGLIDVVPRIEDVALNVPVLGFALGLAALSAVAFGLAPLWQIGRDQRAGLLHATTWGDRVQVRRGAKTLLLVGQVTLTTLLLVGAGLLIQSLIRLQRVPVGIDPESVVTAKISLTKARLPNGTAISEFLARLTGDLRQTPGVTAAGISSAIPLSPGALTITQVAGQAGSFVTCEWRLVDAGYFRALGIPVLHGRLFGSADGPSAPRAFVISEQTARALYGRGDPVGRRLRLENGASGEIVGVVANVRMRNLGEPPERVVYFPPAQFGFFPLFNIVVRTDGPAELAAAAIRDRLRAQDPGLAAFEVHRMTHWIGRSASLMRIRTQLATLLGAIALLLGAIGIYGVMSHLVAQRHREFGIRLALGARPAVLPFVVVRQALRYAVSGIVLGLGAAAVISDRISGLLFDIDGRDPATFATVALVVGLTAIIASYAPARRVARTDPLLVLRSE
jgi:putative ABC transport system permease protein